MDWRGRERRLAENGRGPAHDARKEHCRVLGRRCCCAKDEGGGCAQWVGAKNGSSTGERESAALGTWYVSYMRGDAAERADDWRGFERKVFVLEGRCFFVVARGQSET